MALLTASVRLMRMFGYRFSSICKRSTSRLTKSSTSQIQLGLDGNFNISASIAMTEFSLYASMIDNTLRPVFCNKVSGRETQIYILRFQLHVDVCIVPMQVA